MCYEVFNRSAADTYRRMVQRERLETERATAATAANGFGAAVGKFDWGSLFNFVGKIAYRFRWWLTGILAVVVLTAIFSFFNSPSVRLALYGAHPQYHYPDQEPVRVLVSFHSSFKSWSELQGRLDTPLEDKQFQELGNLTLTKDTNGPPQITARANEWIQQSRVAGQEFVGRTVPRSDPSLTDSVVEMDQDGNVTARSAMMTPRVAKSLLFIMPTLPKGTIRRGRHWSQPVKWVETVGNFKFFWSGELSWTLKDRQIRGGVVCDHYVYKGRLHPQIWAAPAWCAQGARHFAFHGQSHGEAYFETRSYVLAANNFTYGGAFRLPISDVQRVPEELRIGREVHGAGNIVIEVENTIDASSPSTH
jgi:hypothetical protein